MAHTIAVLSQKGGTGKTTTVRALADAFRRRGVHTLAVDLDPQGNLSDYFGLATGEPSIADVLCGRSAAAEAISNDLIPANLALAEAELLLAGKMGRELRLRRALADVSDGYELILIDCPPSLGLLTVNALTAATGVVIPLECEYFALRGMALLLDTIEKVRKRLNPELRVEGILATMLDSRTLHSREVLGRVTDAFGDKLFQTLVHKTIRFAEAPVAGEPILTYAPKSNGADEYRNLAREVMSR
jgi:chromosome partitioning protein